MTALRVLSFNIRNNVAQDGENHWLYRREMVAELIRAQQADVVGAQEVYRAQVEDLLQALPEYGSLGVGPGARLCSWL